MWRAEWVITLIFLINVVNLPIVSPGFLKRNMLRAKKIENRYSEKDIETLKKFDESSTGSKGLHPLHVNCCWEGRGGLSLTKPFLFW